MKELSIEQKAQRYDEAIKRIQSYVVDEYGCTRIKVVDVFPELKELKDENIRKWLIHYFKEVCDNVSEKEKKGVLAWLEKQGEHANFRNKIQIGDKVTRNEDGVLVNLSQLNRVAKKQGEQNLYVNDNAKEMFIKALECVEEQNAKGYKLTDCDKNSWWEDFKNYTSCTIEQKTAEEVNGEDYGIDSLYHAQRILEKTLGKVDGYQSDDGILEHKAAITAVKKLYEQNPWSEEDEKLLALSLNNLTELKDRFGKEYGRTGDCIEWLKSIKDRVQPQPKQEWSKEDEEKMVSIFLGIEAFCPSIIYGNGKEELLNWLKSLKDRYTWKPSDEQMYNLSEAAHYRTEFWDCDILIGLYDELKKLKG